MYLLYIFYKPCIRKGHKFIIFYRGVNNLLLLQRHVLFIIFFFVKHFFGYLLMKKTPQKWLSRNSFDYFFHADCISRQNCVIHNGFQDSKTLLKTTLLEHLYHPKNVLHYKIYFKRKLNLIK